MVLEEREEIRKRERARSRRTVRNGMVRRVRRIEEMEVFGLGGLWDEVGERESEEDEREGGL